MTNEALRIWSIDLFALFYDTTKSTQRKTPMQTQTTERMGKASPERPSGAPNERNVRDSNAGTMPNRIMHTQAYQRGLRAGGNEDDTGELAECPYTMPEMIEDFWRGVRDRIDSAEHQGE